MDPFQEQHDSTFLFYAKLKFKVLLPCDKTVSLLVDEIHLKPYFDYKGGNIAGAAYNSEQPANLAFVFMITSLFSSLKDVVYIIPSTKMKSEVLYRLILKTITGLETIGFRVISVITDNNAINGRAMSPFSSPPQKSIVYPHPSDSSRPLFLILDSVHILKCIRTNWLNQTKFLWIIVCYFGSFKTFASPRMPLESKIQLQTFCQIIASKQSGASKC